MIEMTPSNSLNIASVHQKQPVPNVAVSVEFIEKKIEGASYELEDSPDLLLITKNCFLFPVDPFQGNQFLCGSYY
jgi:hypothetical protein